MMSRIPVSVIDPHQAIECGMTPSQLRATANSLERIARRGYGKKQPAYDRRQAYDTARKLRRVAREVTTMTHFCNSFKETKYVKSLMEEKNV